MANQSGTKLLHQHYKLQSGFYLGLEFFTPMIPSIFDLITRVYERIDAYNKSKTEREPTKLVLV